MNYKAIQLRKHKLLATGLFLLMLLVYILMTWLLRTQPAGWMGYVKAFSEAAMVGALADWFAVTALFHHPLGIPIPHTNLIENSKKAIGNNLGNFVVTNFLTAKNIRPYIQKLTVTAYAADWLEKEKNKKILINEIIKLLNDIIGKLEDKQVADFIARKGNELLDTIELNKIVANALHYFLDKKEHEKLITALAEKIKGYISENGEMIKEKVKKESYFFVPNFVDNKLAEKITNGLVNYFDEIEKDNNHHIRAEIAAQLYQFAAGLQTEPKWKEEFLQLKNTLLSVEKVEEYAAAIWQSLKATLQKELQSNDSALVSYFHKTMNDLVVNLKTDTALQHNIDGWVRHTAYKYILRNTEGVGLLISNTVGNWKGRELSQKLELEVGKDLQFIRINGTVVGGLVGLLIYSITKWIG